MEVGNIGRVNDTLDSITHLESELSLRSLLTRGHFHDNG
jgi:hypothetical protein